VFKLKNFYKFIGIVPAFYALDLGGGGGSSTTTTTLSPEQQQLLAAQTQAFTGTFLPAYQTAISGAQDVYNQSSPYLNNAALNTYNQAQTSQGTSNAVANAANNFALNASNFAGNAENSGSSGIQGATGALNYLGGAGGQTGLSGTSNVANQQNAYGLNLTNIGAGALQNLFSPQYEQQQVQGALAPAEYAAQQANVGMNAGFAGAGQLDSSRNALANQQTQALNNQMLGSVAAQTEAGIQQQQYNAANALLGAGQGAMGQAGSLYSGLYGTGSSNINNAGGLYSNLLNSGVNAGNVAVNAGQLGLAGTNQAVANAGQGITAANAPMSLYSSLANILYGTPSGATPNFTGTQGTTTSGTGSQFGFSI